MTRLCVAITVESAAQALAEAARGAERGADLVEYRLDRVAMKPDGSQIAAEVVQRSPLPCIVTIRPTWEGGEYDGPPQQRLDVFRAAAAHQPAYLDVELAAYTGSAKFHEAIDAMVDHPGQVGRTTTGLMLSTHDFERRPTDLFQRIEAMLSTSACRVIKVAWMSRSLRDNLEAFELILDQHKPTVALCMGEEGLASRVLAKKFGALLTYAGLEHGTGTAPGQVGVETMKRLYRWDRLNAETQVFGVIGHPVGHSMSPAIHNAGFDAIDYNGVYLPMPVPQAYESFKATVGAWLDFGAMNFRGASVTIPHKQNLLKFVAERGGEVEPLSRTIGAANTLAVHEDGSLYACNTDYAAALDCVCATLNVKREGLSGKRVFVIGAGGVGRAVVAGYAQYGASIRVSDVDRQRVTQLAEEFDGKTGRVSTATLERMEDEPADIIVNCSPVGMHPHEQASPIERWPAWAGDGTVVFDMVYNPIRTRMVREAADRQCRTISGVEMFVRQAVGQFELWTGKTAPGEEFRRVVLERIGGDRVT